MEGERQREQDELYRGDHAGGNRQEVPTGMGGAADEVSFHFALEHVERLDVTMVEC